MLDENMPKYQLIKNTLIKMIESGEILEGDLIPSERKLVKEYGASRMTVRKSLLFMINQGYIQPVHGLGYKVMRPELYGDLTQLLGFAEELREKHQGCTLEIIGKEWVVPSLQIQESLGLEESGKDELVLQVIRLVKIGGNVLGIDYTYLPKSLGLLFEDQDFGEILIYRFLEQKEYVIDYCRQSIYACSLGERERVLFNEEPVALGISRIAFSKEGIPLVLSYTKYNSKRYQYSVVLSRRPVRGGN